MPIPALQLTAAAGSEPARRELRGEDGQDLETARRDGLPVALLLRNGDDLAGFRQLRGVVVDRGRKNPHKGLASYLLGVGQDQVLLVEGRYDSSGQLLRSVRTLLARAQANGERNLYLIGAPAAIFAELWEQAGPARPSAEAGPVEAGRAPLPSPGGSGALPLALMPLLADRDSQPPPELVARFVGQSRGAQLVRQLIVRAARVESPILILGDTGSGKEVVAREIHRYSARQAQPFVAVNCGAIPGELFEAELFGYGKGAHSTAHANRMGLWEYAGEGTLFLDEIADLEPRHQVKILRALEEKQVRMIGHNQPIPVRARVIAATNRDLFALVQAEKFRDDLYYRLRGFLIRTVPLRDHPEDIPLLIQALWQRVTPTATPPLPPALLAELQACPWPGNVRQLKMILSNLYALFPQVAAQDALGVEHLRAVFYLEGEALAAPAGSGADDAFSAHRAECLRHLRRVDEAVQATQATVSPLIEEERADAATVAAIQATLGLRIGELEALCGRPLLFHHEAAFTAVYQFKGKLRYFQNLLQEEVRQARRYWVQDVHEELQRVRSALFREVERVLAPA